VGVGIAILVIQDHCWNPSSRGSWFAFLFQGMRCTPETPGDPRGVV
jgi:hypothetical protein